MGSWIIFGPKFWKAEFSWKKFFSFSRPLNCTHLIRTALYNTNYLSLGVFTKFVRLLDRCKVTPSSIVKIITKRIMFCPTEMVDTLVLLESVVKEYSQNEKDYLYHHFMNTINKYRMVLGTCANVYRKILILKKVYF